MNRWRKLVFALATAALALNVSCGGDENGNNGVDDNSANANSSSGGKGDFSDPLVCNVRNATQRQVDATQLRDPVAAHLLRGGDCPTNHHEMVEKFQKNHLNDSGAAGGTNNGSVGEECERALESYIVSETAQILESTTGANYRAVVSRKCGDTDRHELLWSLFGISGDGENWRIPQNNIELVAYDDSAGVYNYYVMDGGEFEFFGNSKDFMNGTGGRCQSCHTAGELVMKELDTPWLHWEGHEDIPGAADLVNNNSELLGSKGTGSTIEGITNRGNRQYNEARAEWMLFEADTKEMLKPLFCTVQVNLDNGADFKSTKISKIPGDFFLDREFTSFRRKVDMSTEVYEAMLDETGSTVPGFDGQFNDTIFAFPFPERSAVDQDFVETIVDGISTDAGTVRVIDEEFMTDVLMVDFTRPIFSDARCDLLQFAPDVDFIAGLQSGPADQDPGPTNSSTNNGATNGATNAQPGSSEVNFADEIRAGFIANLEAASPAEGTAAADLLARLQDPEDDHDAELDAFMTACNERDETEMMRDVARVNSVYRKLALGLHVFEFQEVMPVDNLNDSPELRFDPETCVAE